MEGLGIARIECGRDSGREGGSRGRRKGERVGNERGYGKGRGGFKYLFLDRNGIPTGWCGWKGKGWAGSGMNRVGEGYGGLRSG